ncbi:MAG: thermonuclease family protein [Fuerstiella sp.]
MFLNRELVIRGLAWHYKFYSDDKRLADDEDNARLKKLGLRIRSAVREDIV